MSTTDIANMALHLIQTDGDTQARVQLDWIALDEYAAAMAEGAQFPPVIVYQDAGGYWLADGFHRLEAAKRAGRGWLEAEVRQGSRRDALLFACGANASHGVRRTNADKRRAVTLLLEDAEWSHWSDREIARRCNVSNQYVSELRQKLTVNVDSEPPTARAYITKHGTPAVMQTANIGGNGKAKPEPVYFDDDEDEDATVKLSCPQCGAVISDEGGASSTAYLLCNACGWFEEESGVDATEFEISTGVTCVIDDDGEEQDPPDISDRMATSHIAVINADSARYLADYVHDPVHLVITSPPYNVGIEYDAYHDGSAVHTEMLTEVWRQCYDLLVNGGRIAVVVPFGVGRNPWEPVAYRIMEQLVSVGFTLRGQIIWDKGTSGNRTTWGSFRLPSDPSLRDTTECIVVAHKGQSRLPLSDDAKQQDGKGTYSPWLQESDYFMELAQDHWTVPPESAQRIGHPAPFPVELVRRLVQFYGYRGCHVLDPFAGSGTVGVAARQLGFDATLMEFSADYCALAKKRIADAKPS